MKNPRLVSGLSSTLARAYMENEDRTYGLRGPVGGRVGIVGVTELSHYPRRILRDIYPLSRGEYRVANLERRASYSYLMQTIDACTKVCEGVRALVKETN